MQIKSITMETLGGGALIERLNDELETIIENIKDVNREASATRELKLSVKIYPGDDRQACGYKIEVSSKLAARREVCGTVYVGKEGDKYVAYESNPNQGQLNFDKGDQDAPSKVHATEQGEVK